jgi:thiamine pyrophosphate-dependent acetolactate synthase large subunit-like protein
MPSCGEAVVRLLEQSGADTVFGIPGVHTLEIYRGLSTSPLRHIAPCHEQGAAFMADGWARVSGRPGVCTLISGPGLTNAITPIAQAYHDSIPLLIISGAVAEQERGWGEIHDLPDQQGLMAAVTAFSHTVRDPAELPEVFSSAVEVFRSGRPRPVHIAVPVDVLRGEAALATDSIRPPPPRPQPAPAALVSAAALLARAQKPVLILGGGARDAGPEAVALAESLGAPIGLTINARGTVSDAHELCLGSALSFPPISAMLRDADVTLLVGAELSNLDLWGLEEPLQPKALIRVDIDAGQLTRRWDPVVALHGDAASTLAALAEAVGVELPPASEPRASRRAAAAKRVREARARLDPPAEIGRFAELITALDRALPDERVVAGDSTQPVYAANHLLPMYRPRSWMMPIGYGCLGCALPMAIGAKLAAPERPVIAIAGDGGFMFSVQELATAVALGLTLPVLVYNNNGYGEIREAMDHTGIRRLGTESHHDIVGIARGFGCAATRITAVDELDGALAGAFASSGPTVVELTETFA